MKEFILDGSNIANTEQENKLNCNTEPGFVEDNEKGIILESSVVEATETAGSFDRTEADNLIKEEFANDNLIEEEFADDAEAGFIEETETYDDIKELRTEFIKQYKNKDNTYSAVIYSEPVHYLNEKNQFMQINNELVFKKGSRKFENKKNSFSVNFNEELNSDDIFTIEKEGYKAVLTLGESAFKSNAENGGGKTLSKKAATKTDSITSAEAKKHNYCVKSSKLVYQNFKNNADVEYSLLPGRIKENIIIKEKAGNYEFDFDLKLDKLDIKLSADNKSLELCAADTGKLIFTIPAPFMFDAENSYCSNVKFSVAEKAENIYSFKIIPDAEWINASERKFPVTVDPQIVSSSASIITVKSYAGANEAFIAEAVKYAGYYDKDNNSNKQQDIKVKLNLTEILTKAFEKNSRILNATLELTKAKQSIANGASNGFDVKYGAKTIDFLKPANNNLKVCVDVTEQFNNLKSAGGNLEIIISAKVLGSDYMAIASELITEVSSKPVIYIDYVSEKINAKNQTYHTTDVKRAGTGSVNLFSGNLNFTHPDISTDSSVMPIGISHIYNGYNAGKKFSCEQYLNDEKALTQNYYTGCGWKLNLHQNLVKKPKPENDLFKYIGDVYTYIDGAGNYHEFRERYYYIMRGEKIYLEKNQITIGYDGKLDFGGLEVKPEIKTSSGLELVYSLDGFKNSDKIEKRAEDVVKLSDEVEQYEKGIKQLNESLGNSTFYIDYYPKAKGDASQQYEKDRLDHEKGKLENIEVPRTKEDLVKYQNKLDEKRFQLNRLIEMTPVDFIKDESGNVMGFEKNGKLVMLSDKYENQIFIEYENGKIIKVYDGEEKITGFAYEKDLLSKITAPDGNITEFYYIAEKLKFIYYPDGGRTMFEYDDKCRLTEVIEPSGYGVRYVYDVNSKIEKAQEVSLTSKISKTGLIENCYTQAGEIYCIENGYCVSGSKFDFIDKYQTGAFVNIVYNGFSTEITNNKGVKTVYIFDIAGRKVTAYEMQNEITASKSVAFDYNNDNRAFTISPYNTAAIHTVGPFTFPDPNAESKSTTTLNISALLNGTDFILSGWAKAQSAYISPNRITSFSKSLIDQKHIDSFDANKLKRKFELKAEVRYTLDGSEKDEFYCSFDFHNTGWQYVAFAVTLRKNETPVDLKIVADYSCNVNTAEFKDIKLCEGVWELNEFDKEGNVIHSLNSEKSESFTEYNDKNKPVKVSILKDGISFDNVYNYNSKDDLVRTIDYNGLVNENIYDTKGRVIKTLVYNLSDPTSKLYSEKEYAKNGQVLADIDPRGEENGKTIKTSYDYIDGTNIVSGIKSAKGNRTAYGYDVRNGNLNSLSGISAGEDNLNLYGYTMGLMTSASHNGTNYDYEYDGYLRPVKTFVADNIYLENVYTDGGSSGADSTTVNLNNGESFKTEYDKYGKATKLLYNNGTNGYVSLVENFYDDNGKLTGSVDKSGGLEYNTIYTYDKKGNVLKCSRSHGTASDPITDLDLTNAYQDNKIASSSVTIGNVTKAYSYQYDNKPESNLVSLSLPNGLNYKPAYDGLGRLTTESLNSANAEVLSQNYYYLKNGDHATNMVSSIWYGLNGIIKDNLKYSYDKNGNIEKVFENGVLKCRYTYDELDRLIREDNRYIGKTETYKYDAGGNTTLKTAYGFTLEDDLEKVSPTAQIPYGYKTSGWKDQLTSYNGQSFVYDSLGNPTTYKGKTLTWERGRSLKSYDGKTFTYNADGIRTSKSVNGVTTKYTVNGSSILKEERSGVNIWYHYGTDGITGFNCNGTECVYRKNLQGDITHIYNLSGQLLAKYIYDAWGGHKVLGANGVEDNDPNFIGNVNPFRYRGYYYDTSIGLYYLNSRYYDSEIGRFINADDIGCLDTSLINGLNLYAYCGNNPVMRVDESGRGWLKKLLIGIAVGVAAVGLALLVVAATVATGGAALALVAVGTVCIATSVSAVTGGLTNERNGGSFEAGFVGGAISGAISSTIGVFFPYLGATFGVGIGNFVGSLATSYIDNGLGYSNMSHQEIWAKAATKGAIAFGLSLFSGGIIAGAFGDVIKNAAVTIVERVIITAVNLLIGWLSDLATSKK